MLGSHVTWLVQGPIGGEGKSCSLRQLESCSPAVAAMHDAIRQEVSTIVGIAVVLPLPAGQNHKPDGGPNFP